MNGITVILISAVILLIGYLGYGRWLANKWGIDKNAITPARRMEDGQNFQPSSRFAVFAHQFSSICGAGPVTGTIVAMAFGWVPVILWVLIGGIFFGAVHDFGALYASVRNNGKSLAQLIDKYIGRTGRRLFLLFSWLFCIIVDAAFTSIVAGTFKMTTTDGVLDVTKSYASGTAGTISLLFTFFAIAFGFLNRRFKLKGITEFLVAIGMLVVMFAVGMQFPIYLDTNGWIAVVMVYLFFAAAMPIRTLKVPRDYLTTIMMVAMIVCAVLGIAILSFTGQGEMTAPAFVGFSYTTVAGVTNYIFPLLFVSVACGALSGFHSLVSSGTSSKQLSSEEDALPVGFGAMVLESLVGVIAIVCAGIMFTQMNNLGTGVLDGGTPSTPFQIFAAAISKGMQSFGINGTFATVFMTMNVSALAMTSLDAVARIARLSFSEFFATSNDALAINENKSGANKILCNPWFATVVTLIPGLALAFGGYNNIWPLFGASNQLLGGMTMVCLAVFCKCTGRKGTMLYVPVAFLLVCTFTSLVQSIITCVNALAAGGVSVIATSGLQLVFAVLLVVLGLIVSYNCLKEFFNKKAGSIPDEEPEWTEMGREHVAEQEKSSSSAATKLVEV